MIVLAVDPATLCGYAVRWPDGRYTSGTWNLKPASHEGPGMRQVRFRAYLTRLVEQSRPGIIAFEDIRRHAGTSAAHVYGALVGVIQEIGETFGVEYSGVHWNLVKAHATGKGNVDKAAMLAAAAAKWGGEWGVDRVNEADARWIAETAFAQIGR